MHPEGFMTAEAVSERADVLSACEPQVRLKRKADPSASGMISQQLGVLEYAGRMPK